MKKITKKSTPQDRLNNNIPITVAKLLTDLGVIISKSNIENYKQWMKKPFTGWLLGVKYSKNINFEFMIIHDCMVLHHKQWIDDCVEEIRNDASDHILSKLNKPVQKLGIKKIAAKKMARK